MDAVEKGPELGFTLGEWTAPTGNGTYTVMGDRAEVDISLENLVPDGVYTIWCATVTTPPSFRIVDIPCGNSYGTENVAIADSQGHLTARISTPAMPDASDTVIPMVALAYHSDGNTYGEYPGDFGLNAHVQTFAVIPAPGDDAWSSNMASQ